MSQAVRNFPMQVPSMAAAPGNMMMKMPNMANMPAMPFNMSMQ